jgi:hypothetical protein
MNRRQVKRETYQSNSESAFNPQLREELKCLNSIYDSQIIFICFYVTRNHNKEKLFLYNIQQEHIGHWGILYKQYLGDDN